MSDRDYKQGVLHGVLIASTTAAMTGVGLVVTDTVVNPTMFHRKAAAAGAGRYVVDQQTGSTRFEWVGCSETQGEEPK